MLVYFPREPPKRISKPVPVKQPGSAGIPASNPACGPMRNLTLGRICGIPIRLNISLVIFLPVLAWLIGTLTPVTALLIHVPG